MKHLVLIDPDDGARGVAARLRDAGHEVLETDEQRALELLREGVDAVFVWNAGDAARAASLLDELQSDRRTPVHFFAPSPSDAVSSAPPSPAVELVGESTSMRDLRAMVRRLARRPRTHVLVGGEQGTGKHAFARALHRSTRPQGVFVLASPERLSPLLDTGFGELARQGGTLYLTDIDGVSRADQRRLAAWLAEQDAASGEPVRLVAAATLGAERLPLECVRCDTMQPELSVRLPMAVELPPLRKRATDVPALVQHFLRAWAAASRLSEPQISHAAIELLKTHSWPGNLRELANVLECAAVTAGAVIDAAGLPALGPRESTFDYELPREGIDFSEFERAVLSQALRRAGGNQTRAASLLGLTRDQIRYRMGKFGLVRETPTPRPRAPEDQTS